MDNPPNIKAITKAAEIEEAQQAEVNKLQKERRSSLDLRKYMGQNGLSSISKDVFYEADTHWKVAIVSGLMLNGLLGYGSEEFLHTYAPSFLLTVRNYLTPQLTRSILHWAVVIVSTLAVHLFRLRPLNRPWAVTSKGYIHQLAGRVHQAWVIAWILRSFKIGYSCHSC